MLTFVKKLLQIRQRSMFDSDFVSMLFISQKVLNVYGLVLIPSVLFFGLNEAKAQAAACVAGETLQTFNFPAGSWPAGTTTHLPFTVGTGATAVNLTFNIVASTPFSGGTPDQLVHGGIADVVRAGHTTNGANVLLSTSNVAFSRSVNKLSFASTDIDLSNNNWQDVVVTRVNGATTPTTMTGGASHTINVGTGTATATTNLNCANTDPACNVISGFNTTNINTASQQFRTGPGHDGAQQFVGWGNFAWCLPTRADIQLTKTDGRTSVQAGDTTTYTVAMVNNGPSLADGLLLQDAAAAGLTKTGTITCTYGGGAAGPANPTIAQMQTGFAIPTLPSGGTVSCSISALVN